MRTLTPSHARRPRFVRVSAVAACLITVVSCSAPQPRTDEDGTTQITVAVIPTFDASPLLVGQKEGIFAKHNLDVEVKFAEGGAAIIPGVMSGDYDFGYSNIISELAAIDQGLPITLVHSAWASPLAVEDDDYGVVALPESGITAAADLAEANIAVNTLQNIGEVTIRMALENQGVDTSGIQFTQLNYADMADALQRGDVDAAWYPEPFLQQALLRGTRRVLSPGVSALPDAVGGYYLATQQYVTENPDIAEAFSQALTEANDFASQNPELIRQSAVDEMGFDAAAAAAAKLPPYPNTIDIDSTREFARRAISYGIIDNEPDYDTIFWNPPTQP